MLDKIKKKLKEKKIFIPLIVFLSIVAFSGIWWAISSHRVGSPDEQAVKEDELIAREIAENYQGRIELSKFKERLDGHEIEKIYRQYRKEEYGAIVIYYVKFKNEEGYYLIRATPGDQVLIDTAFGKSPIALDTQLSTGERVFYGNDIFYDILTTVPQVQTDKSQYIIVGASLVFFIIIIWFFWAVMIRGGGFTKAQLQEAKKPVYFKDVGGVDEALGECAEIVRMMKTRGGENDKK